MRDHPKADIKWRKVSICFQKTHTGCCVEKKLKGGNGQSRKNGKNEKVRDKGVWVKI